MRFLSSIYISQLTEGGVTY